MKNVSKLFFGPDLINENDRYTKAYLYHLKRQKIFFGESAKQTVSIGKTSQNTYYKRWQLVKLVAFKGLICKYIFALYCTHTPDT